VPRLEDQLCFPLYAGARLVMQAYAPLLGELGLTYPQYLVLMVLWESDGVSVQQIGEKLYLDSGTLTPLLQRLAAAGLIRRERSGRDERTVENWLTRAGRALERRASKVPRDLFCQLAMPMSDFKQLRGSLQALLERLAGMVEAQADK
jgi:MarR family transcriptional regulator, organic hydroperoxide resistance regulator